MNIKDEHFGFTAEHLASARICNGPLPRMGLGVPSRTQIFTASPEDLYLMLDLWFWEGPTELIPSDDVAKEVLELIRTRPDTSDEEVQQAISLCLSYIAGEM